MDQRIATLTETFPEIFEGVRPIIDLEDDFVVIEVRGGIDRPENQDGSVASADFASEDSEDEVLGDLDRFDERDAALEPPLIVGNVASILRDELANRERALWSVVRRLRRRIGGKFPGAPTEMPRAREMPPPDALAFYLPFHRYPEDWGIYLLDVGVDLLARALVRICSGQVYLTLQEARRIAYVYLFHHEQYHAAVESFAIRSELAARKPIYRRGLRKLFMKPWIPGSPHEETLATAYALRKVRDGLKLPPPKLAAAIDGLSEYLTYCSAPYAAGVNYIDNAAFRELELRLEEEAVHQSRRTLVLEPEAWAIGTYMMAPIIQRNRRYSWICDRKDFRKRSKLAIHYHRPKDVIGCLQRLDSAIHREQGGKHEHLVRDSQRRTQVPHGEIRDGTLNKMLKDLGFDLNVYKFREKCRELGRAIS